VWDSSKDQNYFKFAKRERRRNSAARQEQKESAGTDSRLDWDDEDRET